MDAQNISFNPHNDIWRFQSDMLRMQQVQAEHGERLARLERRQDDDARLKSVWGASSPFPSVLGGTPQQVPLQHPPNEPFASFDEDQNNMLGSLHLDASEEPRRIGATSRANSVRFDESANQGWAHTSRSSIDLIPRTGSGLGGHPLSERTYSHKSDGRQSSAGQSVHSATSGRANSLGLDTSCSIQASGSPLDTPGLAPGLFILGSVPSIIRCWLNTNFKHDALLYAAICTGSYSSSLGSRLVDMLKLYDRVETDEDGTQRINLAVYLPEAIQHSVTTRSASPAPQIPSFSVNFVVFNSDDDRGPSKAIQIFLGSDVLRAHNADILFSSNTMTMFDNDRTKLSIPLVRPENEKAFNTLGVSSGIFRPSTQSHRSPHTTAATTAPVPIPTSNKLAHRESLKNAPPSSDDDGIATTTSSSGRPSLDQPSTIPGLLSTKPTPNKDPTDSAPSSTTTTTSRPPPAIWSNWRRESEKPPTTNPTMDWASASKSSAPPPPNYHRRDTGIKVLKPVKSTARSVSSAAAAQNASPSTAGTGQSRFFGEGGKRRTSVTSASESGESHSKRVVSAAAAVGTAREVSSEAGVLKENAGMKTKSNPIGGASAFGWLRSDGEGR